MIAHDGAVLVADANYPRLLRYTAAGERLGDVAPTPLRTRKGSSALRCRLSSAPTARECRASMQASAAVPAGARRWDRLAAVHLAIRLLQLSLGQAFAACGTFTSAALDGGSPGVEWHKIEIDADLPEGTWLKVQTATADAPSALANPTTIPFAGPDDDLLTISGPVGCRTKTRAAP